MRAVVTTPYCFVGKEVEGGACINGFCCAAERSERAVSGVVERVRVASIAVVGTHFDFVRIWIILELRAITDLHRHRYAGRM
jgi:hypothetical protein